MSGGYTKYYYGMKLSKYLDNGTIVQKTTIHTIIDIFKLLHVEGFKVDLRFLYTDNLSIRLLFSGKASDKE